MLFRVRHFAFGVMLSLPVLLAGCGAPAIPAQATVTMIDRKCEIIETIKREIDDPRGSGTKIQAEEKNSVTGECKSVDEWRDVREKRTKDVAGTATVHVDYQAPQDGATHSATLTFTGRADQFYALNAGDSIDILVASDNPDKIRKA